MVKSYPRVPAIGTAPLRRVLAVATLMMLGLSGVASAQSREFMMNECSNVGHTFYRDLSARTDMQYNGQRTDGTHAINGRIYLEARAADFACSYDRAGRRMVAFYADGSLQNAYLPGAGSGNASGQGEIVRVTGVATNDVLNVRSGPGTTFGIVGALGNGDRVRSLRCQNQGSARWCEIEMMTDMRERGWVNARYLTGGAAVQLPSSPPAIGAGQTTTMRVRFPAGATGTELGGSLAPGASHRYLLGARNGQILSFRLAASGPDMSWQILNPDGSLMDRATSGRGYRGSLWQSGDHVVEVINRSNRTQGYTAIFGID